MQSWQSMIRVSQKCHFINAEDPTRSLRYVHEADSLLIVGESHKVGHHREDHYLNLKNLAMRYSVLKSINTSGRHRIMNRPETFRTLGI